MTKALILIVMCISVSIGFITLIYFLKIKQTKPNWYKELKSEEEKEYYKNLQKKKGNNKDEKRR